MVYHLLSAVSDEGSSDANTVIVAPVPETNRGLAHVCGLHIKLIFPPIKIQHSHVRGVRVDAS